MQTSIPRSGQPRAIAGLIADMRDADLISAFNAEASANILLGLGVVNPGTERQAKLPAAGTDIFMGVGAFRLGHQVDTGGFDLVSGSSGGIAPKGGFEVCREGRLWVILDADVVTIVPFKDRGYLRYATNGGNTVLGAWSNASDSGKNLDLTKVVQFLSPVVTAADGSTKLALASIEAVNKP